MPLGASRIPCSAGPQPHLIPGSSSSSGAGMVVAGDTEAQHTQDLKATSSPVVAPKGTSHQFPASHIPVLPLWGCLCPPSFPLPFQHWIWKHQTELSVDSSATSQRDAPSRDRSPIPVLPGVPHQFFTTLELFQHWSPFQEPNTGVWPGKEGCAWTYWKSYTGVAVPSAWPRALPTDFPETPRAASGHVPLGKTGEEAASTSSPLFFVLLNPISMWDIQVWMDKTPTQAAAEAMPHLGTRVPEPGVTNDQDLPTLSVVGSIFICLEVACAELPGLSGANANLWPDVQDWQSLESLGTPGSVSRWDLCLGRGVVFSQKLGWQQLQAVPALTELCWGIWDLLLLQVLNLLNY